MKQDFYNAFWTFGNHESIPMYRRIGRRSTGGLDGRAMFLEEWHHWYDSEECVKKIAETGANILHCRFFKGMGWEYEKNDFEAVKNFALRCRKYGIKVLAYIQYSTLYYEFMEREIPDLENWAAKDEHGNFIPYVMASNYFRWMPCTTSKDYISYLKNIIRIASEGKCFDGVMFDNCYAVHCYCPRCLKKFREYLKENYDPAEFGLPDFEHVRFPSEAAIQQWTEIKDLMIIAALEFWNGNNKNNFVEMKKYAEEIAPDLIVSGNAGSPRRSTIFSTFCQDFNYFTDTFDLLVSQTGNEPQIWNGRVVSRIREMMACEYLKLPVYPLSDSDAGGDLMKPGLLLAQLMECRVWGGITGDRSIMTPKRAKFINEKARQERGAVNRKYFDISEKYKSSFTAPDCAEVGVLLSIQSQKLSQESQYALLSWEELLMTKHVPFRLIVSDGKNIDGLDKCRVLLLSGQRCLSDAEVQQILDFQSKGGVVIGDINCGDFDELHRMRAENPFADKITLTEVLDSKQDISDWMMAVRLPENGDKVFAEIQDVLENGLHIEAAPEVRCRMQKDGNRRIVHFVNYTGAPSAEPKIELNGKPLSVTLTKAEEGEFVSWCMAEWNE